MREGLTHADAGDLMALGGYRVTTVQLLLRRPIYSVTRGEQHRVLTANHTVYDRTPAHPWRVLGGLTIDETPDAWLRRLLAHGWVLTDKEGKETQA